MECLPLTTKSSLWRRSVYTLCHRCFYFPSREFFPPPLAFSARQHVSSPTRRYIASGGLNAARNSNDSSDDSDASQAYPLSGYYADILNTDSPYRKRPITSRPVSQPSEPTEDTTSAPATESQSPQDKMSIVLGTRLASPGYRSTRYNPASMSPESTWKTINGVAIPPRPQEPDNCCMSGCVHCVWDDFRDEMEQWAGRVEHAKAKGATRSPVGDMLHGPRPEVDNASISMDDDGGGSESNWPVPDQAEDLFAGIPVGIREFMKTEKKLREKHQHEATA